MEVDVWVVLDVDMLPGDWLVLLLVVVVLEDWVLVDEDPLDVPPPTPAPPTGTGVSMPRIPIVLLPEV